MVEQLAGLFDHRAGDFGIELAEAAAVAGGAEDAVEAEPLGEELFEGAFGPRVIEHAAGGGCDLLGRGEFAARGGGEQFGAGHRVPEEVGEAAGGFVLRVSSAALDAEEEMG